MFDSLLLVSPGLGPDEVPFVGVVRAVLLDEVEPFAARLVLVLAAPFFDHDTAVEARPAHGCGWVWGVKVMQAIRVAIKRKGFV